MSSKRSISNTFSPIRNTIRRSGKMVAAKKAIDRQKYGKLLARTLPAVIETETENEHFLTEIEKLIDKDQRSAEEDKLLDLMTTLVEDFEEKNYPIPDAPPHEALRELMASRGLKQRDLLGIFGSDGIASEVVNGKRNISRAHAKSLAEYFHVPVDLFI
jgi:HTH-type transcriptional regulator / antitoxin HigA